MFKQMITFAAVAGLVLALAPAAQAMDFVTVGDPGNDGEWSGESYGGYGPDRVCGAVDYTYRIGTYEVTAAQWIASGVGDADDPHWGTGSQPAAYVSWHEAAQFCNWMTTTDKTKGYYTIAGDGTASIPAGVTHKAYADANGRTFFIPTEDEWYKAAYYKGGGTEAGYWDYPTSSNDAPIAVAEGTTSGTAVFDGQADPAAVDNAGGLSPYDTMGQGGNVWEWNEALISGSDRGLRGGVFVGHDSSLLAAHRKGSAYPTSENGFVGFRVSEVPEPATLALLALGGVWVLGRRRNVR